VNFGNGSSGMYMMNRKVYAIDSSCRLTCIDINRMEEIVTSK